MSGKPAAHIIEHMVAVSAIRARGFLHDWFSNSNAAEMNVPAWPIPTHHTKLTMFIPHETVLFSPSTPMPKYQILIADMAPIASIAMHTATMTLLAVLYFGEISSIMARVCFVMHQWPGVDVGCK